MAYENTVADTKARLNLYQHLWLLRRLRDYRDMPWFFGYLNFAELQSFLDFLDSEDSAAFRYALAPLPPGASVEEADRAAQTKFTNISDRDELRNFLSFLDSPDSKEFRDRIRAKSRTAPTLEDNRPSPAVVPPTLEDKKPSPAVVPPAAPPKAIKTVVPEREPPRSYWRRAANEVTSRLPEFLLGLGAGFALRTGFRMAAVAIAGTALPALVVAAAAGAAAGGILAVWRANRRMTTETAAQRNAVYAKAFVQGAAVGALGGFIGGWLAGEFAEHVLYPRPPIPEPYVPPTPEPYTPPVPEPYVPPTPEPYVPPTPEPEIPPCPVTTPTPILPCAPDCSGTVVYVVPDDCNCHPCIPHGEPWHPHPDYCAPDGSDTYTHGGSDYANTDGSNYHAHDRLGHWNHHGSDANTDSSNACDTDGSDYSNTDGAGSYNTDGSDYSSTDGSNYSNTDGSGYSGADGSHYSNADGANYCGPEPEYCEPQPTCEPKPEYCEPEPWCPPEPCEPVAPPYCESSSSISQWAENEVTLHNPTRPICINQNVEQIVCVA